VTAQTAGSRTTLASSRIIYSNFRRKRHSKGVVPGRLACLVTYGKDDACSDIWGTGATRIATEEWSSRRTIAIENKRYDMRYVRGRAGEPWWEHESLS